MLDQTKINGHQVVDQRSSRSRKSSSVPSAIHDVMELAELQAKLLIADSKAAGRRATGPLIALIVGFCFALSAAPVLLIATAELLIEYAALTNVTAYLASSAVGMLVGMSLLLVGYGGLRSSVGELKKSVEELAENISCIKRTLRPRDPSQ